MNDNAQHGYFVDQYDNDPIESRANLGAGFVTWFAVGAAGGFAAYSNLGPAWAQFGTNASLLLAALFCFWKPSESDFKLSMLGALRGSAAFLLLIGLAHIYVRIGWAALSGELKHSGVATLPGMALILSALGAVTGWVVVTGIDWAVRKDNIRRCQPRKPKSVRESVQRGHRARGTADSDNAKGNSRASSGRQSRSSGDSDTETARGRRQASDGQGRSGEAGAASGPAGGGAGQDGARQSDHGGGFQGNGPRGADNRSDSRPETEAKGSAPAWWEVLKVTPDCTLADAEAAALTLIRQCHPDRYMAHPAAFTETAGEVTKSILAARDEARRVLSRG